MLLWNRGDKSDKPEGGAQARPSAPSAGAARPAAPAEQTVPSTLADLLLAERKVSEEQLAKALARQQKTGEFLGEILTKEGIIEENSLISFMAKHCKVPHLSLLDYLIEEPILQIIPHDLCLKHRLLPIDRLGKNLTVAMVNPLDREALEAVKKCCPDLRIKPILCAYQHFETVIQRASDARRTGPIEMSASSFGLKIPGHKPKPVPPPAPATPPVPPAEAPAVSAVPETPPSPPQETRAAAPEPELSAPAEISETIEQPIVAGAWEQAPDIQREEPGPERPWSERTAFGQKLVSPSPSFDEIFDTGVVMNLASPPRATEAELRVEPTGLESSASAIEEATEEALIEEEIPEALEVTDPEVIEEVAAPEIEEAAPEQQEVAVEPPATDIEAPALDSEQMLDTVFPPKHAEPPAPPSSGEDENWGSMMEQMAMVMLNSMRSTYEMLARRVELFRGLSPEDVARIFARSITVEFAGSQIIFSKGDAADKMYLILGGQVSIEDGDRKIALLNRGDIFGEMALVSHEARSASARALSSTSVLALDLHVLKNVMPREVSTQLLINIIVTLSARLRKANEQMDDESAGPGLM